MPKFFRYREIAITLLYDALDEPYGIVVTHIDDTRSFLVQLRKYRDESPDLASLELTLSPTDPTGSIWIVQKDKYHEATQAHAKPVRRRLASP